MPDSSLIPTKTLPSIFPVISGFENRLDVFPPFNLKLPFSYFIPNLYPNFASVFATTEAFISASSIGPPFTLK